jgi:glyoxylase-like metal-dependent hydrolase (beta-lactamase superfamily II)
VTVYVAGDLFEKEEDLLDPEVWRSAGSDDPDLQAANRAKVVRAADFIVPGHGPMFKVTPSHRETVDIV